MTDRTSTANAAPTTSSGFRAYAERTELAALIDLARSRPELSSTLAIVVVTSAIYLFTSSRDRQELDYFVRLADAFIHGRMTLLEAPSWLNELIPAGPGEWYVAYPPFPALLLVPVVAIFGTSIHEQVLSSIVGAGAVGLAWQLFRVFALSTRARVLLTVAFGFGSVLWYVSEVGSVWYYASVVGVFFLLAALNLAFRRRAPLLVGLFLGCAATSRLPIALGAPAIAAILVDLHRSRPMPRLWPALRMLVPYAVGLAIPIGLYALYNVARWGTPIDQGYVAIPGVLDDPYYSKHGILSLWYVPRNLFAIFFRSWNYVDDPPFLQPSWWGLSIFLTTPLYLWLFKSRLSDPRVAWSLLGVGLIAIPIVTHGNVGTTQFGYRFSLDFQPFLFVMLATVLERGLSRLAIAATAVGVVGCAYAIWAISIGFVAF
ncbi:MAG TPA: hypothetical protein VFS32_05335 [Candidatus Limnocylindrales bacterium]|nr:hypothetical protein [Candidatus Limnocylindrales bacterium]